MGTMLNFCQKEGRVVAWPILCQTKGQTGERGILSSPSFTALRRAAGKGVDMPPLFHRAFGLEARRAGTRFSFSVISSSAVCSPVGSLMKEGQLWLWLCDYSWIGLHLVPGSMICKLRIHRSCFVRRVVLCRAESYNWNRSITVC